MGNRLYKIVSTASIVGVFVAVGLLICSVTLIEFNYVIGGILGIIAVLCISCILALPWIKQIEEKTNKVLALIFLSIIGVNAILWIIFIIMIMSKTASDVDIGNTELNLLRFSFILTTQILVSSTVLNVILKYKKSMILFQIITYLSNLFVDVYFTTIFVTVTIADGSISFDNVPKFMVSKFILTLLFIAFVYVLLSNTIMKIIDKKKFDNMVTTDNSTVVIDNTNSNSSSDVDVTEKLKQLKDLLDKGLIFQEDYENKKQDILKDM